MTDKKTKSQPAKTDPNTPNLALRADTSLASMFDQFFRPFDEFFQPFFPQTTDTPLSRRESLRQPILDIQDRGDHFSVTAELPGFTKDQVQVKVDSNGLELRAEKTETTKGEKGAHQESSRSYYQYLSLPDQVIADKIDGTMKNGILELKLPKRVSKLKDTSRRVDLK
ncbi:MAG TPA: Hsp20/alpha crystallin family protein [Nitrososphaerales archaeon]|nr:Hsp20/alpha crystallin family protein [Nitrososphaerales archaeon]